MVSHFMMLFKIIHIFFGVANHAHRCSLLPFIRISMFYSGRLYAKEINN